MSMGRLFHALGAATENARSDETSLERGTTRSCLPAKRREARPGMLATGETNSVRIYQDLPGSIHEDTVMDGHRQGKKANAYKYPSRSSSDDQASS